MDKERIQKKILNMKVGGKHPRQSPRSRWEKQVRKDIRWREGRTWNKTEAEEEVWEGRDG
jgi:hypothetical protein